HDGDDLGQTHQRLGGAEDDLGRRDRRYVHQCRPRVRLLLHRDQQQPGATPVLRPSCRAAASVFALAAVACTPSDGHHAPVASRTARLTQSPAMSPRPRPPGPPYRRANVLPSIPPGRPDITVTTSISKHAWIYV